MEDQLVVSIDHLRRPASLQSLHDIDDTPFSFHEDYSTSQIVEVGECDALDDKHLNQTVECRICQEDDNLNNLEIPCACKGTLKFAHRRCVQLWCNEKADTTCEICHQPYQPGYSAYRPEVTSNASREAWTISHTPLDLHDPQTVTIASMERRVLDHGDHVYHSNNAIAFCRSVTLTLIILLLLRQAASLFNDSVEKALTHFSLFLYRAAAFILPCYLMARLIRMIQIRHQRQVSEVATISEVISLITSSYYFLKEYQMFVCILYDFKCELGEHSKAIYNSIDMTKFLSRVGFG